MLTNITIGHNYLFFATVILQLGYFYMNIVMFSIPITIIRLIFIT